MHGTFDPRDPELNDRFAAVARDHIAQGMLATPPNMAMFWAFDSDEKSVDRNLSVLGRFRETKKREGYDFISMRELEGYRKFSGYLSLVKCADLYSAAFADNISGDTVTFAVDNAKPSDYFRLAEMPRLMNNAAIKTVRNLTQGPVDAQTPSAFLYSYAEEKLPVSDWLLHQRRQWFDKSLERSHEEVTTCTTNGGRWLERLSRAKLDVVEELEDAKLRLRATVRQLHDRTPALIALDRAMMEEGARWIQGLTRVPADLESRLRPFREVPADDVVATPVTSQKMTHGL